MEGEEKVWQVLRDLYSGGIDLQRKSLQIIPKLGLAKYAPHGLNESDGKWKRSKRDDIHNMGRVVGSQWVRHVTYSMKPYKIGNKEVILRFFPMCLRWKLY